MRTLSLFTLFTVCPFSFTQEARVHKADVVVYGGTAGGAIAAVTVAREGRSVLLLEPGTHIGGMASGGLGATDVGNRNAIGGYSLEFFQRVKAHYARKYGEKSEQVRDCVDGFRFEPNVAELVLREMLTEAKVEIHFNRRLMGIEFESRRIRRILAGEKDTAEYHAAVFIDATYEGDLMAKAKVSHAVGREGRDKYGETLAGVQKFSPFHQWPVKLNPFLDRKMLLPLIQAEPQGETGQGDHKVQAYNFRLCLTQRPDLRLPWPKPKKYDPARYELLARYLEKRHEVKFGQLCNPVKVPNGKTDTNNNGPISTDHIGANWNYPDAPHSIRKQIWADHEEYQKGFFYFLANDKRVPKKLQEEVNSWGLSRGEFEDTDYWPHQLYIREARRMVGEYVMTQKDLFEDRHKDDSVGLASYTADSHHVQRVVGPDGFVLNEGDFQVPLRPFAISYRSLVPRESECRNLLVPVCLSSSHVAYGSIRMEPVFMVLGQASAVAACQSIDTRVAVQNISIEKLHATLKAQKAVLSPSEIPQVKKARGIALDVKKLGGILVDDPAAKMTGTWVPSSSTSGFIGEGYLHDNNEAQGKFAIRYAPRLPHKGEYEVRLFYPPFSNRASNVMVIIHHANGNKSVRVNQKVLPTPDKGLSLGVFSFHEGESAYVEIRNDDANGHVIADAVLWLPVKGK